MMILFMVGGGLMTAACAIVGQHIGRNDVANARKYYNTFRWLGGLIIVSIVLLQHYFIN